MAVDNKRIRVGELDFDGIKQNLKTYLQGQSEFSDYDFEGSGMSVLLDVLAYNTHYNALYTNLAINEMFLDSAAKRSSITSIASMLGYTPRSAIGSRALVNVTVTNVPNNPPVLYIPTLQPFPASGSFSNTYGAYNFYNLNAAVAQRTESNTYVFQNVEIIEGTPLTYRFLVEENTQYILPNDNVDTSTIRVRVQDSPDAPTYVSYSLNTSVVNTTNKTKIFFLKEIEGGRFQIYFGDGVVSEKPSVGNIVTVEYMTVNGDAVNNVRIFTYGGTSIGGGIASVTTVQPSSGGSPAETNESVRFNAVRAFAAQNRTVTAEDYKIIIPQLYPNIDTISVWGGEENDPPIYGKVFICIKPKTGSVLSAAAKSNLIETILTSRNVVSITPTIIDPTYLDIVLEVNYYFNQLKTKYSESTLTSLVKDTISSYNSTELKSFDSVFRLSRLQRLIDTTEDAIVSSVVRVKLNRSIVPNFTTNSSYTINFHNPIYNEPGSTAGSNVTSTSFTISGQTNNYFFDDDTQGNLRLFYLATDGQRVYVDNAAGSIDYGLGKIVINSINISSAVNDILTFTVEPSSYDVISVRDQLVRIDEARTLVYGIPDRVASGEYVSGSNYIFTPNRN
jgi:hypothetical protein